MYLTFYNRIKNSLGEDIHFPLVNIWSDSFEKEKVIPTTIYFHSLIDEIGGHLKTMNSCLRVKLFYDDGTFAGYFEGITVNTVYDDNLHSSIDVLSWGNFLFPNDLEKAFCYTVSDTYVNIHKNETDYSHPFKVNEKRKNYIKNLIDNYL